MIGQDDHAPLAQHPGEDVLAWRVGFLIHGPEDALDGLAQHFIFRVAGKRLGDRVDEGDAPIGVRRHHRVADAVKGDVEPFALLVRALLAWLKSAVRAATVSCKLSRCRRNSVSARGAPRFPA